MSNSFLFIMGDSRFNSRFFMQTSLIVLRVISSELPVFIRLLMSEVSSDSKVKHIHKQTFCKRYFLLLKIYTPSAKKLSRKEVIK